LAYYVVAKALGKRYLATPPPDTGFRCMVTGLDGIPTFWSVSSRELPGLAKKLARAGCQVVADPVGAAEPPSWP
jgi:hypothetical protein